MKNVLLAALLAGTCASPVFANSAESSDNAKAVLNSLSNNWVSIKTDESNDVVSFFPLAGWRCHLQSVHYGFNGSDATTPLTMAPCGDTDLTYAMHVNRSSGTTSSVKVKVVYSDGTSSESTMTRDSVLQN